MDSKRLKILSSEQINRAEWTQLSQSARLSTWFQSPECFDLYDATPQLDAFAFGITEEDQLIAVIVGYATPSTGLLRHFSRRAIIQGGMLIANDCPTGAVQALLKHVTTALSDTIYIELRNFNDYSSYRSAFEASGFNYMPHYDIHVNTAADKDIMSALSESKRRQYRKALSLGVTCRQSDNEQDLHDFYQLLRRHYRRRVRRPLMEFDFFRKVVLQKHGILLCVKTKEGEVIGGMLCVGMRNLFEWYICGNEKKSHLYPSTVATIEALLLSQRLGHQNFDFMGAGEPGVKYGVRDFKMKFGGELLELGRYIHVNKSVRYKIGSLIINAVK